jgi:hemerythrin-like domain-containing protein
MKDPVTHWHEEHARFSRLLDYLDAQLAGFHDGGRPNYELMGDILYYLKTFADRQHHPREDVAFALLARREPSLRPLIARLTQEHRVIDTVGAELHDCLSDILGDVMVERAKVEAAAATYLVYYRAHIEAEERDILPAAARLLTPADWQEVLAAVPAIPDPLFGAETGVNYRTLRTQVEAEALAA